MTPECASAYIQGGSTFILKNSYRVHTNPSFRNDKPIKNLMGTFTNIYVFVCVCVCGFGCVFHLALKIYYPLNHHWIRVSLFFPSSSSPFSFLFYSFRSFVFISSHLISDRQFNINFIFMFNFHFKQEKKMNQKILVLNWIRTQQEAWLFLKKKSLSWHNNEYCVFFSHFEIIAEMY